MGRPKREEQPPPTVARAPCKIGPDGAPDPPYDLRLGGASLERVQADVERWGLRYRRNPDGQLERVWPTYEELDAEGKRIADERMVRKWRPKP